METIRKQNFTNVQKELLKLYAWEVSEKELLEIRQLLANYFAKKVVANADKAWDKNEYNEDWGNRMLNKEGWYERCNRRKCSSNKSASKF